MRPELAEAARLLQGGEMANLERALELIQGTVFAFSMKVCGHPEDAEDTMQDVLIKSLPYLRKIENPRALAVWLYKVTRNRCWMSRRRSKFAPDVTLSLEELMPDGNELAALTSKDPVSLERRVDQQREAERVQQAILRIPPKYRLILVLHDMEELDTDEVSRITGLRPGTVRVRLHRARLFVRRELSAARNPRGAARGKKIRKPPSCRQMFAGLSEYIDRRVDDLECQRVQKHLQDCPACLAFVNDLSRAVERCKSLETRCESRTADKLRKLLMAEYQRFAEA
ncbi:MAG: sigma-70 family RNA polymerase sigma factor [Acidobacteriaceae bacterium]